MSNQSLIVNSSPEVEQLNNLSPISNSKRIRVGKIVANPDVLLGAEAEVTDDDSKNNSTRSGRSVRLRQQYQHSTSTDIRNNNKIKPSTETPQVSNNGRLKEGLRDEKKKTKPRDFRSDMPRASDRVPRACVLCRSSKLKCDSQRPCSRCVHGKRGHLCVDAPPPSKLKCDDHSHDHSALSTPTPTPAHAHVHAAAPTTTTPGVRGRKRKVPLPNNNTNINANPNSNMMMMNNVNNMNTVAAAAAMNMAFANPMMSQPISALTNPLILAALSELNQLAASTALLQQLGLGGNNSNNNHHHQSNQNNTHSHHHNNSMNVGDNNVNTNMGVGAHNMSMNNMNMNNMNMNNQSNATSALTLLAQMQLNAGLLNSLSQNQGMNMNVNMNQGWIQNLSNNMLIGNQNQNQNQHQSQHQNQNQNQTTNNTNDNHTNTVNLSSNISTINPLNAPSSSVPNLSSILSALTHSKPLSPLNAARNSVNASLTNTNVQRPSHNHNPHPPSPPGVGTMLALLQQQRSTPTQQPTSTSMFIKTGEATPPSSAPLTPMSEPPSPQTNANTLQSITELRQVRG